MFQNIGAAALRGERAIAVLGHARARARHHEGGYGRDVKRGARAAARAAGIEQRLRVYARVDSNGLLAHGPRETQQFLGSLALHAQAHQERRYLRRGGRAAQNGEHGFVSFGGRQILAGGDLVQERQQHGGLWFHVTMSTRNGFMRLAAIAIAFMISALYAQEHPAPSRGA